MTWLEDHPTGDIANMPIPSVADVLADAQRKADVLTERIDLLSSHQRDMRERAASVPMKQKSVDGYEKLSAEKFALADREDAAGRPEAALAAVQAARTARDMFGVKQPAIEALIAQVDAWDFSAHEAEITALVRKRNEHWAILADPQLVEPIIMDVIDARQAARDRSHDALITMLAHSTEITSPAYVAAQVAAEGRMKIEAREAAMQHTATPAKRTNNAGAAALAAMAHGGRVGNPVAMGVRS